MSTGSGTFQPTLPTMQSTSKRCDELTSVNAACESFSSKAGDHLISYFAETASSVSLPWRARQPRSRTIKPALRFPFPLFFFLTTTTIFESHQRARACTITTSIKVCDNVLSLHPSSTHISGQPSSCSASIFSLPSRSRVLDSASSAICMADRGVHLDHHTLARNLALPTPT